MGKDKSVGSIGDRLRRIRFNYAFLCCDLILPFFLVLRVCCAAFSMWCISSVDVNLVFDYALRVLLRPVAFNAKEGLKSLCTRFS